MTPDRYCQEQTRRAHSSFYYPLLLLPRPQRQAMFALYAYCRAVDDLVDPPLPGPGIPPPRPNPLLAKQVEAWQEELTRLARGQPGHPITRALHQARETFALPMEPLGSILEGMRQDLVPRHLATLGELEAYSQLVAGAVGEWTVLILGVADPAGTAIAHHLGLACQFTNVLRDLGEDARRGRLYLPGEWLTAEGVDVADLSSGRWSPALERVAMRLADLARDHFAAAQTLIVPYRRALRSVGMMGAIYQAQLDQLRDHRFQVFDRSHRLPTALKLWIVLNHLFTAR